MVDHGAVAPMRVALVCPYSLSRPGGVQGQVLGLARSLERRGHRVTVYAPSDGPVETPEGVDLVISGTSVSLPGNGSIAPVSISPLAARRAMAHLRAGTFDVVHMHEPFAPGLTYALLSSRRLPPVVGTFHRSGGSVLYRVLAPVARWMAGHLAARCAVSEAAASTASKALGGTYDVLFNGIEVDRFDGVSAWPTEGSTALFLGRHEERKGLAVLLEAWRLMIASFQGTAGASAPPVLWIAGDGPETDGLRRRYPDSESVRWLGVLGEEEKIRRLVAADVLVAPSLGGESFGMVLLEAMAARTVVVASDIDGYRDAAGGRAVLVPPLDPTALDAAIRGVFDGTAALEQLVGAGPGEVDGAGDGRGRWLELGADRAATWSMASLAERYEECYRSVMVGDRP